MKVVLVRHGRPDENEAARPNDPPLNVDGWLQARAVATLLAREGITRIVASPLTRARQTAEPLSQLSGLPVDIAEGWAEADRRQSRYRSTETLRAQGGEEWRRFLEDPIRYLGADPEEFRATGSRASQHVDAGWFHGAGQPTKAIKAEAGYRLLGAKALVPMAAQCSHLLVLASCDGADEAFIVPTRELGVRISAPKGILGLRASAMADIALENVFVPANMRLGENAGANVQRIIDSSRVALSAILTGLPLEMWYRNARSETFLMPVPTLSPTKGSLWSAFAVRLLAVELRWACKLRSANFMRPTWRVNALLRTTASGGS